MPINLCTGTATPLRHQNGLPPKLQGFQGSVTLSIESAPWSKSFTTGRCPQKAAICCKAVYASPVVLIILRTSIHGIYSSLASSI
ncbi:uncharacterized protein N7500_004375 [Penicillium coprophilum]|uniref:uncharacterized protein n=1 Tax=Penicillium coprophilum TaxID=36646 RepID=UPI00239240CC|nr:uncharacterized protein N7500_004375 [Penicillium coprophilum]KAJ5171592.1 hypothetical protein N7500_004375 [Penicillium coprophilum]